MDLFSSVAERMQEGSPDIRPLIPSPFESSRQEEGFEIESVEIEGRTPTESSGRLDQPEATNTRRISAPEESQPAIERTAVPQNATEQQTPLQPPIERSIENSSRVASRSLDPQEPAEPSRPAFSIPEPPAPIERLVYVNESPSAVESPPSRVDEQSPHEPEVVRERQPSVPPSEFVTQHTSTAVENQNVWIRQFEIDASTQTTYAPVTVNRDAPSIVIPANPIEVAVYPTATESQVIREISVETRGEAQAEIDRPEPATVVDIRIGRIEVNAVRDRPPERRGAPRQQNTRLSLDELLKKRGRP